MSRVDQLIAFAFVLALMPLIATGMLVANLAGAVVETVSDVIAVLGIALHDDW